MGSTYTGLCEVHSNTRGDIHLQRMFELQRNSIEFVQQGGERWKGCIFLEIEATSGTEHELVLLKRDMIHRMLNLFVHQAQVMTQILGAGERGRPKSWKMPEVTMKKLVFHPST